MQLRGHVLCPNEHVCVNADKLGGTGHFEPFGGAASNSPADAVALVASRWSSPVKLITAGLPVAFDAAPDELDRLVAEHPPTL